VHFSFANENGEVDICLVVCKPDLKSINEASADFNGVHQFGSIVRGEIFMAKWYSHA